MEGDEEEDLSCDMTWWLGGGESLEAVRMGSILGGYVARYYFARHPLISTLFIWNSLFKLVK